MPHTNSTSNYQLPQFLGSDKPQWLTDVNPAYETIDGAMHTNAENITSVTNSFNNFKEEQTSQNNTFIDEISSLQSRTNTLENNLEWGDAININGSSSNTNLTFEDTDQSLKIRQTKDGKFIWLEGGFNLVMPELASDSPATTFHYNTTIQLTPAVALTNLPSEQKTYNISILESNYYCHLGSNKTDGLTINSSYALTSIPFPFNSTISYRYDDTAYTEYFGDKYETYITTAGSIVINLTVPNFLFDYRTVPSTSQYFNIKPVILPLFW